MKTLLFLLTTIIIALSSCSTMQKTISYEQVQNHIKTVEENLNNLDDYKLTGLGTTTEKEATGVVSNYWGFGISTNRILTNETDFIELNFINEESNKVSIVLATKSSTDQDGKPYVKEINVTRCSCDNLEHFDTVCGKFGFVQTINNIQPDQTSRIYDSGKSVLAIILMSTLILLLPVI